VITSVGAEVLLVVAALPTLTDLLAVLNKARTGKMKPIYLKEENNENAIDNKH
jgi:hypothetical protein